MHLVRLGGGLIGAALLAVAVPATTGAGPFGSAAPRPAEAASSCNNFKVVTKGFGSQEESAAVPVNRGSTNCLLGPGNRQGGVGVLQSALNACNGQHLKVDQRYGPDTAAAVKAVQGRVGAKPDGVYGPETASKMRWPF